MSQPFVGEIRMFGGNFAPVGWALCQGQTIPISENEVLFQLIGTTYGGDGQSTFQLPDLQGRSPIHQGSSFVIGQRAGTETVTLSVPQIPGHTHAANCAGVAAGNAQTPANNFWGFDGSGQFGNYAVASDGAQMAVPAVQNTGGSQPHDNRQPFVVINFIISLFGIFPSQT